MLASPHGSRPEIAAIDTVPTPTPPPPSTARDLAAPPRRLPRSKPTIRLVAERAEVAISTVSRVVNGGRVSEGVRRRVQRVIDELGYSPSFAAQALVRRQTGSIGLAVNSTQSPWFSQVLLGIEQALSPSRRSVLLASTMLENHYDPETVRAWITHRRVDGLIFVRYSQHDRPLLEAATRTNLPAVLVAPDVMAPDHVALRCDNLSAGRHVAKHLADLGHLRIAFAGGPEESVDTRQRLEGLQQGLVKHGLRVDAEDIWFGTTTERDTGVEHAGSFLARSPCDRPSAVVLANDPMALGFMRTVLKHGVRVPQEVSVVGFDGTPDGEQCWPGLTTALQPTQRMAMTACRALLDRIERRQPEKRALLAEFTGKVLVRESTAAAPGAELAIHRRP